MAAVNSHRGAKEPLLVEHQMDDDLRPLEVHPLIVHLTSNYIIVRSILSHLDWREQASCAQVCRLWRDTVKSLQRENLQSYDFVVDVRAHPTTNVVTTLSERPLLARPLFAIAFCNTLGLERQFCCQEFVTAPCAPPCDKKHGMLTAVESTLMSKDAELLGVVGSRLIYMPPPNAETAHFTLRNKRLSVPFLAGLYIPKIPYVKCHTLQYSILETARPDMYDEVDEICATEIIKGVIVFVEDRFMLLDNKSLDFLNYFKSKQPDVPFAMGGCVVELAIRSTPSDVIAPPVTLAVVTVLRRPDPAPGPRCEFHMYSHVIERTVFRKAAINKSIEAFSQSIPDMEFSAALKLSCVGRECLHNVEQERFRSCFPRTTLLGCYGNGELGYNVPPPAPAAAAPPAPPAKRPRAGLPDFCYSYSTVFVYFGWGKVRRPRTSSD